MRQDGRGARAGLAAGGLRAPGVGGPASPMPRRLLLLGAGALLGPAIAGAQPRPARLGYLGIARGPLADAFLQGVREFGYVEGQNLVVERRQYEGNIARLPEMARELVQLGLDAIFATGPGAVGAVARATRDVPLVAIDLESDPLEAGFARSLGRPGGNVTGVFLDLPELIGKWFEFLRAVVPSLSLAGVLWDPATGDAQYRAARAIGRAIRIRLETVEIRGPGDVPAALARLARARVAALVQLSSPLVFLEAARIAAFTAAERLPAISLFRVFPDAGGLMSYGPDIADLYRRCGVYAGRILAGAKPGELPIERPSRFFLTINRKAASMQGLAIPPAMLVQADHVVD